MGNFEEQRKHPRENFTVTIDFTVLLTQSSEYKRVASSGQTIDKSPIGLGIITDFPLEAGHVLQWDDQHRKGNLHMAVVKWVQPVENRYRAGLFFI
jgi:hypothetical protein